MQFTEQEQYFLLERLLSNTWLSDSHWLCTTINHAGYGRIYLYRQGLLAHRVSWTILKEAIPSGLTIDHLCRVRNCWNPDHLEPVTGAVNTARGGNAVKKYCPKGHLYDYQSPHDRRHRQCKECKREAVRRWRSKS